MAGVEDKELTPQQLVHLSRAKALILAQFVIAGEIADQTMRSEEDVPAIVQALATNYLAVVTKAVG